MANVRTGIKRILWILSIGASIAAWIALFANADLAPQKKVNEAGIAFINELDRHYSEYTSGIKLSEFSKFTDKHQGEIFDRIISVIEDSVKGDSLERWPYMWDMKSSENVAGFDAPAALRGLYQDRLREALRVNEKQIKTTFPDVRIVPFMQRYGIIEEEPKIGMEKYFKPTPESYFEVTYRRPYGTIILLAVIGFIPFIAIWLMWFLTRWVIRGFQ